MVDYEKYRIKLLDNGISEEGAYQAVMQMIKEDKLLDAKICPDCGTEILFKKDLSGTRVEYRCACGFMVDREER